VLEIAAHEGAGHLVKSNLHQCSFLLPDIIVQKIKQKMSIGYSALRNRVLATMPAGPFDVNNPYPTFTV